MEKTSTGSVIDKGNINEIFKEARLKVIDDTKEEPINKEAKEEIKEKPKKESEKVYETLTMSDFFDEFKI